jgi:hypothetical protein
MQPGQCTQCYFGDDLCIYGSAATYPLGTSLNVHYCVGLDIDPRKECDLP